MLDMHEVRGSSPLPPTIESNASSGTRPPETRDPRERQASAGTCCGHRWAGHHPRVAGEPVRDPPVSAETQSARRGSREIGWNRGRPQRPSRPGWTRGLFVFRRQTAMADQQRPGEPAGPGVIEGHDLALEAPDRGSADELLDAGAHAPLDLMRHSAAHVMAEAVLALFPEARLGIGPAVADGFYYDFELPRPLTPDDLAAIDAQMRESIAADHPFVRREMPFATARALVAAEGQAYKAEILDDLAAKAEATGEDLPITTFYEHGPFRDLCRGPHLASTGLIGPFRLLPVAGAYWRGQESRPMLQRVYGTVWEAQEDLDRFLWRREEAKKRDHRRLGVQLDLFSFHDVSPGSAFWHPKGQRLWRTLETAMRELQERHGYEEVSTPILVNHRLWEQSGHWDLSLIHISE